MTQEREPRGVVITNMPSANTILQYDLERFPIARRLLVVSAVDPTRLPKDIATSAEDNPSQVIFDVKGELTSDDLAMVQGYESHGVFSLVDNTLQHGRSDANTSPASQRRSVGQSTGRESAGSSIRDANLADLFASALPATYTLLPVSAAEESGVPVNVSTITVFTEDVDAGQDSAGLEGAGRELWRWAKPNSIYPVGSGSWVLDLSTAIRDGILRAGAGLMILARRASYRDTQAVMSGKLMLW